MMCRPRMFLALLMLLVAWSPLRGEAPVETPPRQVLVVNTQDASVSLVDLATHEGGASATRSGRGPTASPSAGTARPWPSASRTRRRSSSSRCPTSSSRARRTIGKMFNDHIVLTQDGKHILVANFYSDDVVGIDIDTMKEAFRIKDC